MSASSNSSGYGALLDNSTSTVKGKVVVLSADVESSKYDGISITSKGDVILDGIISNGSWGSGNGVYVDNTAGTGTVSVLSTKGANNFNNNTLNGLLIKSNGNITVSTVTANNNSSNGLNLTALAAGSTITLSNVNIKHNSSNGILSVAHGATVFTKVKSYSNGLNTNLDGISVTTNGYDFTFSNSYATGNGRYGINASVGGTSHKVNVIGSVYLGNSQYNTSDVKDINTDGKLTIS